MNIKVLKFGGSSQLFTTYKMILDIINSHNDTKFVIVLSAIKGITNKLLEFIQSKNFSVWNDIIDINKTLSVESLGLVDDFITHMENKFWDVNDDKIEIVSIGEFFTTHILNTFLNNNNVKSKWLSSYEVIKSNQNNIGLYNKGEFSVDSEKIINQFTTNQVVVIPGFSGSALDNKPCLLGRGGSDTTGSIIAHSLYASSYEIWTDVDGIYSSDPRKIKDTFIIPSINFNIAQEIAAMGAKVIHPYCILPCAERHIPIVIKNTFNPSADITTNINSHINKDNVYAVALQENVKVFKITSVNMWNNYGFVFDIFSVFKKYNIDVNIINTSQFNITTTTDDTHLENLEQVRNELSKKYTVELEFDNTIVSVIGDNIKSYDKIAKIFDIAKKYDIITTSYSSNDMTLSFVVNNFDAPNLAQELHNLLFTKIKFNNQNQWWRKHIDKLTDFIKEPTYVYSLENIKEQINKIKELTSVDKFYYALKANNNPDIVNFIVDNNFGIECVSIEELRFITSNYHSTPILFTPNFCSIDDYIEAIHLKIKHDIKIIIDNPMVIIKYGSIFLNNSIGIRLDVNIGDGHSEKVITQGKDTKFGMTINDLDKLKPYFNLYNIEIEGIHSHMGSGIDDINKYSKLFMHLIDTAISYNVKWIDLGGGFGIKNDIDFKTLDNIFTMLKPNDIQLIIEPGRFIVAKSGILIGSVNQIKTKNNINYIGINIGMNNLIRPTLYNAIHPIYFPLSQKSINKNYKIVGPICESGDVFIDNLLLPCKIKEGDMVIVDETGAYGEVMSSEYNMKPKNNKIIIDELKEYKINYKVAERLEL
jgi:diaminopimelate decarboxylase/aspartate kinase